LKAAILAVSNPTFAKQQRNSLIPLTVYSDEKVFNNGGLFSRVQRLKRRSRMKLVVQR